MPAIAFSSIKNNIYISNGQYFPVHRTQTIA